MNFAWNFENIFALDEASDAYPEFSFDSGNEKHDPSNGQFTSGGGSGSSPHEGKSGNFSEAGSANLEKQGFSPKKKSNGTDLTGALQVAWHVAKQSGNPQTITHTGRGGLTLVKEGDKIPFGQSHMVVMPNGDVKKFHPKRDQAQDNTLALAFDKATVRNIDANGHLHVATTNISKANVCPYYGREIPGYEELGLDEDKIYQLLRDPEELAKAAATFNGKPVLSKHVPVSSADHHPELVIGAIGTDAEFTAPYLRNSLVIWAQPDIDAIESEEKRELSSAYRYRADMTPGTYEGVKFDGVMRDLIGNHVAIVKEGRAGSDVVVGDAAIFPQLKELTMTKVLMSRRAVQTQGALAVYLLPKLAQDAKIDLAPMLKDVTNKNFKAKKKDLIEGVTKITKGKLAQDASLADLDKLLDALGGSDVPEAATGEDKEVVDPNMKEPMEKQPTIDADPAAALMEFLKGKGMSDEDVAAACAMMKPAAVDEDPNDNEEQEGGAMDKDGPEMKPDMVSKKEMATAMDAAIKKVTEANDKRQQELRAAERAVKPYVGELAMDHKTADEVYRATLGALGVEGVEAIHPSAYPAILKSIPLPGAKTNNSNSEVAMDAAAFTSYDKMFPQAARIGNI